MSTQLIETTLGKICQILNGRAYRQNELLSNGKYPVLRVGNFFSRDNWYYSNLELESDKYCDKNDLLFAWSASFGPKIWKGPKVIYHYHIWKLIPKSIVDKYYLYYWLQNSVAMLTAGTHGSVMAHITKNDMENMPITLPDIDIQKKIAEVLSALDDKIELNNQINSNLEQQAQALFKKYFINQFFPGTDQYLGNVCSCTLGGTPSRAKPEYWNGNIPWINSGEANKFRIIEASENITSLGLNKSATKLLPAKTTVIAITGATLGQVSLLEIPACTNQSLVGVIPNDKLPYEFIYPFIKNKIPELLSHQTGGAQQHINKQNVESLKIRVPDKDILNAYIKNVAPIYATITKNCFENSALTKIRDSLLPKLMSGEIDVSKVDIEQIVNNKD